MNLYSNVGLNLDIFRLKLNLSLLTTNMMLNTLLRCQMWDFMVDWNFLIVKYTVSNLSQSWLKKDSFRLVSMTYYISVLLTLTRSHFIHCSFRFLIYSFSKIYLFLCACSILLLTTSWLKILSFLCKMFFYIKFYECLWIGVVNSDSNLNISTGSVC